MTTRRTYNHWSGPLFAGLLYVTGGLLSISHAQFPTNIMADGTLGTTVTPSGSVYNIDGGTVNGANQFHSFSDFDVGTGATANFNAPSGTANILSRVTGRSLSQIDGTLTATDLGTGLLSTANLFLLNTAGILFGRNAQLNVGGSFHATTADRIRFDDAAGTLFNAVPSGADASLDAMNNPLLGIANPVAFGFLTANPAPIDIQTGAFDFDTGELKVLSVPEGQTLSFVSGTVNVGASDSSAPGYLVAPDGRINLVGMGQGEATLDDANGFVLNTVGELGTTNIRGASLVDAKEVFVRGGRLVIDDAIIFPGLFGFTFPDGGQVNVKVANDVTITGTAPEPLTFNPPGIIALAGSGEFPELFPDAKVPDITIDAHSVLVSGFAAVQSNRFGPGLPGNIEVKADTIRLENGGAIALLNSYEGFGGNINLDAREVTLSSDGISPGAVGVMGVVAQSVLHPFFRGQLDPADPPDVDPRLTRAEGGNITVKATESLTVFGDAIISSDSFSFGRSGDIDIDAGNVFLTGTGPVTGAIGAQSFLVGDAGSVTINARGRIEVGGGFRITASTGGSGNAGKVQITADQPITLSGTDSRILNSANQPPDEVLDSLYQFSLFPDGKDFATLKSETGKLNADLFDVLALLRDSGDIVLSDSELLPGNAGPVSVNTPLLTMNADTRIVTSTGWGKLVQVDPNDPNTLERFGNAGDVTVTVGSLSLNDGASIRSRSGAELLTGELQVGAGNAGDIKAAATGSISIAGRSPTSGEGSSISTSTFGDGNAGSITLSANQVDVQSGGSVTSTSGGTVNDQLFVGTGNAGTVTITAVGPNTLTISGKDSTVSTTTSGAGAGGSIFLTSAGNVEILNGGLVSADSLSPNVPAGDTGSITIEAGNSITLSNGTISTKAAQADGGEIKLTAPNIVQLTGSEITTSIFSDSGANGGNINIDPEAVFLNKSKVVANAFAGQGGNIQITANNFIQSADSVVDASSQFGVQGTVVVESPENDIAGSLSQLPQSIVDVSGLLPERCAARYAGGPQSSFVVAGRGGLPTNPDNYLPSFGAGSGPAKSSGITTPGMSLSELGYANQTTVAMAGWGCLR